MNSKGEFVTPIDISDLVNQLACNRGATLLAGGTDLLIEARYGQRSIGDVISLRGVAAELSAISNTEIGAMATWTQILRDGPSQALRESARTVGSPQIRNVATLGGNLATASPAGDSLPVLAALGATVDLISIRGQRSVPINEFVLAPKRNAAAADEIIAKVTLPRGAVSFPQSFAKIGSRNAMVISKVSACAALWPDRLRLSFGAVAPTIVSVDFDLSYVEAVRSSDARVLDQLARTSQLSVTPISDHRATREYRLHAVGVLARRLATRVVA